MAYYGDDMFRFRDEEPLYYMDDWQSEREYYYDLEAQRREDDFDDSDDDFFGYDDIDLHNDRVFQDHLDDIADTAMMIDRFERLQQRRHSIFYDSMRGRQRSKASTIRSWRDPRSIGGATSRKAMVRKMDLRRPLKPTIFAEYTGPRSAHELF